MGAIKAQEIHEKPWGLFLPEENNSATWRIEDQDKSLTEDLAVTLIGAIQAYSSGAAKLLEKVNTYEHWWHKEEYLAPVKKAIADRFVGVIGVELSRLFAIAQESNTASKYPNYIFE